MVNLVLKASLEIFAGGSEDFPPLTVEAAASGAITESYRSKPALAAAVVDEGAAQQVQPPSLVLSDGAKQWSNALIGNFLVDLGEENLVDVAVETVWSPPRCKHCAIFGHSDEKCRKLVCEAVGREVDVQEVAICQKEAVDLDAVDVALSAVSIIGTVEFVDKGIPVCSGILQEEGHDVVRCLPVSVESSNKFDVLGEGCKVVSGVKIDIAEQVVMSPKKGRVAAGGVADLMEQLKPKAKKKGKGKGGRLECLGSE
ncbi:hypothetical protein V6N12_051461 [Hibiscus sabdariffa]|uniref:Uncharacterized protein n=1 Tax=Hibiscus sabdariffa TaxID=183260 RepID=A0ABR2GFF1_9ROSI